MLNITRKVHRLGTARTAEPPTNREDHDDANRLRATRTRVQRHDDALAIEARQKRRNRWLVGWAAAVSDALTDTQITAAVQRVTRPVGGLDRRSAAGGGQPAARRGRHHRDHRTT